MKHPGRTLSTCLALLLFAAAATADDQDAIATYLANEGVMIDHGDTKILFDPLFDNGFGQYQLLPDDMEAALFAGEPPFSDVDAVFISHAHGDHFAPSLMLEYLRAQPGFRLYAPMQAVSALRKIATGDDISLLDRVTGLALDIGDPGLTFELDDVSISAVRVPHSGWPARMTDIENLVFRITLGDSLSVVHLGDAADSAQHFSEQELFWRQRDLALALPPYWFFLSASGSDILQSQLRPARSIGIHVPESMPAEPSLRPDNLKGADLFTRPGETRTINAP